MKRIIFGVVMLMVIIPISVNAYECSNEDKERLQDLANNISASLEEQDNDKFSVVFTGVSKQLRIFNPNNWLYYRNITDNEMGEVRIDDLDLGNTYQFQINSATSICLVEKIRTITVNVPNKNPYYGDEVCNNAKDYSLCQKWTTVNITHDEFVEKVNKYIKDSQNTNKNDYNNIDSNDKNFNFFELYEKYYWPTFIGMICIFGLLVFLWIKENKKNKL